jgi:hypothetical protein
MVPEALLPNDEKALLERASSWPEHTVWTDLTAATLRQVAVALGHDFAVALLHDRLRRSPEHGPFIRQVEALPPGKSAQLSRATLAIVPGAFYRERPETGAGGERLLSIAQRLGCRCVRVPVASFGSLAENARTLCDWLRARPDESFVLVSLSKGTLDVRAALTEPFTACAFRKVIAWVNLSGLFQGTALVTWLKRQRLRRPLVRLYCWWHGYRFSTLTELERRPGSLSDLRFKLPKHMHVLHVMGFPLRRHLNSPLARRAFARLEPWGPSDGGGNLLADAAGWPGVVYPVWGTDHYLRASWDVDALIARVLIHFLTDERLVALEAAQEDQLTREAVC